MYEQNITQQLFSAFEDFEIFRRSEDMSLAKYISEFELKATELKNLKVQLPEELLAFKLLKNANLSEECSRIVRIACNTNAAADTGSGLTLAAMKSTILNAFDCRLDVKATGYVSGNTDATGTVSMEPFKIKSEPSETFYSSSRRSRGENSGYYGKSRGFGRNYNGRANRGRSSFEPYPVTKDKERTYRDNGDRDRQRDGDGRDHGDRREYVNNSDQEGANGRTREPRVNRIDRYTGKGPST